VVQAAGGVGGWVGREIERVSESETGMQAARRQKAEDRQTDRQVTDRQTDK
jgi:hypothetical protein